MSEDGVKLIDGRRVVGHLVKDTSDVAAEDSSEELTIEEDSGSSDLGLSADEACSFTFS